MITNFSTSRPAVVLAVCTALAATVALAAEAPGLTDAEKAEGWRLLFDGKTTNGWRSFKKKTFPSQGWRVEDGTLKKVGGVRGGDIVTDATFGDFDLRWEWRISTNGNNGLKYFITEERGSAIGHEYQMLDDAGHPDGKRGPIRQTASFYDVLPPKAGKTLKPIGEWNSSRVLVQGNHVEHWLNGEKVLEYELGSEAVKAAVAKSKFKDVAGFGTHVRGHILLTDHGDEAAFRNMRLRELPVP